MAILVFDIGTTRVKAGLVDPEGFRVRAFVSEPARIEYPGPGLAEQDLGVLWDQVARMSRLLASSGRVEALVFVTHMAGVVPLGRGGEPLYRMLIWLDERAAGLPRELFQGPLRVSGYNLLRLWELLRITGGAPSRTGKDPLSKIVWFRDRAGFGDRVWLYADLKAYLLGRLTGVYATGLDEASLFWLLDTRRLEEARWHEGLLRRYGLSAEVLPKPMPSTRIVGELGEARARELGLEPGVPVVVGAGDIASVAVGTGAVGLREPHVYIGTSGWLAAHVDRRILDLRHYMGSLPSAVPGRYLFIAEQEVAGAAVDWLLSLLGMEGSYSFVAEALEKTEPGAGGLVFLPWMYGERSPVDEPSLRGALVGLSLAHSRHHVVRAVLEGVALNTRFAYEPFRRNLGLARGTELRLAGGGAELPGYCQLLADVLGEPVRIVAEPRLAGLRGGAVIAAVALGYYRGFEEAAKRIPLGARCEPRSAHHQLYTRAYKRFRMLYQRLAPYYRRAGAEHAP